MWKVYDNDEDKYNDNNIDDGQRTNCYQESSTSEPSAQVSKKSSQNILHVSRANSKLFWKYYPRFKKHWKLLITLETKSDWIHIWHANFVQFCKYNIIAVLLYKWRKGIMSCSCKIILICFRTLSWISLDLLAIWCYVTPNNFRIILSRHVWKLH